LRLTEGYFVETCLSWCSQALLPNLHEIFEDASMNRVTIQRQVADISKDVKNQFSEVIQQDCWG
jgi:hypothetical protein